MNPEFELIKNKISDPNTFGPGIWYCIHMMAKDANTEQKKQKFKIFMEQVIENLPCQTCHDHASDYYRNNPLDPYWNIKEGGEDIGLFKWTWTFHNTVNNRLKKPYVNWENAKMLFNRDSGVCSSDCGGAEQNSENKVKQLQQKDSLVQRFIPKNIIRPNSIEKSPVVIRFKNAG